MDGKDHGYWKKCLSLLPHPEGGHFREIYRSEGTITAVESGGLTENERNYSTAIFFLLGSGEKNSLHRIKSDEIWHYYSGSSLAVYEIEPDGSFRKNLLGLDTERGESPVVVIKAGNWFCAEVTEEDSYTLAGCTVAPGFDFRDFELAEFKLLSDNFPQHSGFIKQFTNR